MPTTIRLFFAVLLLSTVAFALRAASASASTAIPIPHAECSYPGAPDCNMGPPPSGGGSTGGTTGGSTGGGCLNVTTFPSIIPQISPSGCGSTNPGGCLNVTTFPSIIPQVSPSGCGSSPTSTSSSSCPSNYTPSPFGCQPPANTSSSSSSSGGASCANGQVPASQLGIASSTCINPTSSGTTSGGPPPLQTKSCPGYSQQFPVAQSCPVPLPSSSGCDIGVRLSLDAQPETQSQACGTNQTSSSGTPCPGSPGITYSNDKTACPHDLCSGGILAYPGPCASCNFGTAASAADCGQCPGGTGTYGGPDPNAAGCPQGTNCPVDGGTAYPPTSCQTCPGGTGQYLRDSSNCPKPPPASTPAPSASASCGGGSSLLLPAMDLRVGDGPFVCVNCFLPGATTGTLMSSGDCILAGGSWGTDANGGGNASGTSSSRNASASTPLPSDLDTSTGKPFDTCNTLLVGGQAVGALFGNPSPASLANALQAGGQSDFCAGLAAAPHPGLDSNAWMACLNAAMFPQLTHPTENGATYSALSPDDAKAACLNLVPAVSGTTGH